MKLVHPTSGTVVECEGGLAERYLAAGWRDANASVASEKPKRTVRKKSE